MFYVYSKKIEREAITKIVEKALSQTNYGEDLSLSNTDINVADSLTRGTMFVITIKKHNGIRDCIPILQALDKIGWNVKSMSIATIAPNNITNQDIEVKIII